MDKNHPGHLFVTLAPLSQEIESDLQTSWERLKTHWTDLFESGYIQGNLSRQSPLRSDTLNFVSSLIFFSSNQYFREFV